MLLKWIAIFGAKNWYKQLRNLANSNELCKGCSRNCPRGGMGSKHYTCMSEGWGILDFYCPKGGVSVQRFVRWRGAFETLRKCPAGSYHLINLNFEQRDSVNKN